MGGEGEVGKRGGSWGGVGVGSMDEERVEAR